MSEVLAEGVRFAGRGFRTPAVRAGVGGGRATVRVDDADRPDLWAEVTLTRAALVRLLAEIDAADRDAG